MQTYLFTSESVSEGHPDKVADQISDAILDAYLAQDKNSHVAVETLVTTNTIIVSGEVKSTAKVDHKAVALSVVERIGCDDEGFNVRDIKFTDLVHEQSADIDRGVSKEEQGAGDQGMVFGYATDETEECIPATLYLSHLIVKTLAEYRHNNPDCFYKPDSKAQVTIEYAEDGTPLRITDIVVSTQHKEFSDEKTMQAEIRDHIINVIMPLVRKKLYRQNVLELFNSDIRYHINPTGSFLVGGPNGDTGLTGRKIIVDTYGGRGAHGGGAFSGKDPSKVDRSAAYKARYIAKNIVNAGLCKTCLIQLAYVIGEAAPVSVQVTTTGKDSRVKATDAQLAQYIAQKYDLTPKGIESSLRLREVKYLPTASYGHFGRPPMESNDLQPYSFTWESCQDYYFLRKAFGLEEEE